MAPALHRFWIMVISIDSREAKLLREMLQSALRQLRIESSRADSPDFRIELKARGRILEGLIAKLSDEPSPSASR
jgi:hypothetical protein